MRAFYVVWLITILVTIFSARIAQADYVAVGQIRGNVCSWGGFICKFVNIDAIRKEGKLFSLAKVFADVDDYKRGRCWINTKSKSMGLISNAINIFTQPEFLRRQDDGDFEELDVEYLVFKCIKR